MQLENIIKNTIIQKDSPIGFDEFMDMALYHPQYGYYRSNLPKFGTSGDFITAPETSDLFGFTLAKQIKDIGGDVLEFGAGNGVLAAQILFKLDRLKALPGKYYILELSSKLKQKQKQNITKVLPKLVDRVIWLTELPKDFTGTIIANEVLDAMPTKRLIYQDNKWFELGVNFDNGFKWQRFANNFHPKPSLGQNKLSDGYTTEINNVALAWIDSIYNVMQSGVVLLIDYGFTEAEFFHPDRSMGTLRCYKNHKANDNPFINIGKQDITSWVNFSAISSRAKKSGFKIFGYATQAMFLISLGISDFLTAEKDNNKKIKLANEIKQLVMPNIMGESFKVLALSKDSNVELRGFKEQNLLHKL